MKPPPLPAQLEDGELREPRERLCDIDRRFVHAKQEGAYVARVIRSRLDGKAPPSAFGYRDPGSLAIIGRSAAAVDFGFVRITGFAGWLVWGFAHIFFLIGFRSRIAVFLEWAWEWLTYARGARLIIGPAGAR